MNGLDGLRRLAGAALLAFAAAVAATPAAAQAGPGSGAWFDTDQGSVRLISATTAAGESERLAFGLEFRMADGWKIYWRSPGDAGFPPRVDWDGSENVADVRVNWPAPERFSVLGLETVGYKQAVVLPLTVTPKRPGEPVRLAGRLSYLTCEEICIPYETDLALALPAGPAEGAANAHLIDSYRAEVPVRQPPGARAETVPGGLVVEAASVSEAPSADGEGKAAERVALQVAARSATPIATDRLDLLVEGPAGSWFGRPTVERLADDDGAPGHGAILTVTGGGAEAAALARETLTFTLIGDGRAVEADLKPRQGTLRTAALGSGGTGGDGPGAGLPDPSAPLPIADLGLATVLALALLGGLILNLMPCVLPVLSLKLMSLVTKSRAEHRQVRIGFLFASAGIVASFLVLAAAAIGVKLAGLSVGWGIQFQQPVFLTFMVALLVLFTCNMLGLFEFNLPGFLGDRAARAGGANGHLGDFLTGAFATLLATPCTAPFLGTAVGFALGRGAGEILAVFLVLGIGMAIPYLAVAAFPQAVRLLPKPGVWMVWLKRGLALALLGTAVWLLTVLQVAIGTEGAVAVGMMAGLAGIVLGAKKVQNSRLGRFAWPLSALLAVLTVLYPLTVAYDVGPKVRGASATPETIAWEDFDQAAIRAHVADGRTVFVDVTADWCVTCQWNKKTVVETGDVERWLDRPEVVAMRADWTRPDKTIADYLARHGRYGIPFNIVYGPERPDGVVLPELLSERAVLDAAAAASGDPALARR